MFLFVAYLQYVFFGEERKSKVKHKASPAEGELDE